MIETFAFNSFCLFLFMLLTVYFDDGLVFIT